MKGYFGHYKEHHDNAINRAHKVSQIKKKYNVQFVGKKVLDDYGGMNYEAGKAFGFTPKLKKKDILIARDSDKKTRELDLIHEAKEAELMSRGMKYTPAHRLALKEEEKYR